MTQAYTTLFTAALLILGALMIACLVRAILGPRIADRLVSINMTGTIAITRKKGRKYGVNYEWRPIADAAAPDRLGDSELIAGRPVFEAVCLDGLVLPLLLGVFSALVLRRREP